MRHNSVVIVSDNERWLKTVFKESANFFKRDGGPSCSIDYVGNEIKVQAFARANDSVIKFINLRSRRIWSYPANIHAKVVLIQAGFDLRVPYEVVVGMCGEVRDIRAIEGWDDVINREYYKLNKDNWGTSTKRQFDTAEIINALKEY